MRLLTAVAILAVASAALAFATLGRSAPAAIAGVPTPTPTMTPGSYSFANPLPDVADSMIVKTTAVLGRSGLVVITNAPGCGAPTITSEYLTYVGAVSGPLPIPIYETTTEVRWPSPCIDPGESIAFLYIVDGFPPPPPFQGTPTVVFFDSAVATATPTRTPTLTPTSTPTVVPAPFIAIDCDIATGGIQSDCTVSLDQTSLDAAVVFQNSQAVVVSSFDLSVLDSDTSRLDPPAISPGPSGFDGNPDVNQSLFGTSSYNCAAPPPDNDTGNGAPGTAVSFVSCLSPQSGSPQFFTVPAAVPVTLATVRYNISPGATAGAVTLSLQNVSSYNGVFGELASCNPVISVGIECQPATVRLIMAATPTPTPIIPSINKIPDGNAANTDLSVPKANLWLCLAPAACAGPGEGELRVVEHASNVFSDYDNDGIPDASDPDIAGAGLANTELGLGAYEFSVEYDNFVIQSVNPCDIVFGTTSPPGAGSARGPVDELDSSSPANPDCFGDAGPVNNNGTCSMSLVLENVVHFGCVTNGQAQGPIGDFDLASLVLIPHPDLTNDVFPGNDNGVITVLKDNGCELADRLGHPAAGSVNGGLTPVCGDLAVTVRILEGDINLDCTVDVTDEQLISFRYGAFFGSLDYQKWFDLEPATHDLDIDIKDLQKVFGRDDSSCQAPIPDQPPADPPAPFGN